MEAEDIRWTALVLGLLGAICACAALGEAADAADPPEVLGLGLFGGIVQAETVRAACQEGV